MKSNYPLGADISSAPFNESDTVSIDVDIMIVLRKTTKIEIPKEELESSYNFNGIVDEDILRDYTRSQVYLPNEVGRLLDNKNMKKQISKDLSEWYVEDFNVIQI